MAGSVGRIVRAAVALVLLGATSCAAPAPATPPAPAPVHFTVVDLPVGAAPEVLAAAGQDLLVGVRGGDGAPHLLRVGPDSAVTEVPVVPATGYGRTAAWYSVVSDGDRVLAVGGDRGGAHGNVRWSVWSGSLAGVREQPQAFSTFGGWGAGDLIDGVLTPDAAAVVGTWQSSDAGLDVALWTADGDTWSRADSTGTPLASTRASLGFATDATSVGPGIVVVGWQVGGGKGPSPVVWRSTGPMSGWTRTPLPDAGSNGAATSVRCAATCAVAGRADGVLALWRLTDGTWSRVAGVPAVRVGDADPLPAPLDVDGSITQVASEGGPAVRIVRAEEATVAVHTAEGPVGPATAAVAVGGSVYLLAGPDEQTRRLWRADANTLD